MSTDRAGSFGGSAIVMEWLRQGVPLTLLLDMWDPAGPHSAALLAEEGWISPTPAPVATV